MKLQEVASIIIDNMQVSRPTLIAIEGYGGAGKSTLAGKLEKLLDSAYIVPMDDFLIKDKMGNESTDLVMFDRQRLEDQILKPLVEGQSANYQKLEWQTNTLSAPQLMPKADFIIVEGGSSYHPDIAHYYDYKIWVDTPIELAKARGKVRDAGNENETKWDLWAKNDVAYQAKYKPEIRADFITNNEIFRDVSI